MPEGGSAHFPTTHWSIVAGAGRGNSSEALSTLCEAYWFPVYAYIRAAGHHADDARDLTQSFFEHLIETKAVGAATPDRGRFRSFLIASVRNFLANSRDHDRALKRGGGAPLFTLDPSAEDRFRREPSNHDTPDKLYERAWALALLDRVMEQLKVEYSADHRDRRFQLLKPFLLSDGDPPHYETVCSQLSLTDAGARVAVHRLRLRFGELLRHEIARTVACETEIDGEIRYLISALSGAASI